MKKIFAIALALAMVLAMGTTAFAATEKELTAETTSTAAADITAMRSTNATDKAVISVDVTFGDLTFLYVDTTDKGLWQPDTHTYAEGTAGGAWQVVGDNTVTVTNHSNRAVAVTVAAAIDTDVEAAVTVSGGMTEAQTLAAGVENKPNKAASLTCTLTLDGAPTSLDTADYKAIGSVTVTVVPDLNSVDG